MENMNSLSENLEAIKAMIDKLAKGELSIDELVRLEELTRKLYERSVILKYKAFEDRVNSKPEEKLEVVEEPEMAPEEIVEAPVAEIEVEEPVAEPEEEATFDFSIFDEEEEFVPEELEKNEPEVEEHKSITVKEEVKDDEVVTEIQMTDTKTMSFSERLNVEDNSLASKFAGGKLDSLVGAFGLNERLRFINNLFDGSSELFSDAVKVLDNQQGLDQAISKINEFAAQYDWDEEDDSVHEFMNYLNRRYA